MFDRVSIEVPEMGTPRIKQTAKEMGMLLSKSYLPLRRENVDRVNKVWVETDLRCKMTRIWFNAATYTYGNNARGANLAQVRELALRLSETLEFDLDMAEIRTCEVCFDIITANDPNITISAISGGHHRFLRGYEDTIYLERGKKNINRAIRAAFPIKVYNKYKESSHKAPLNTLRTEVLVDMRKMEPCSLNYIGNVWNKVHDVAYKAVQSIDFQKEISIPQNRLNGKAVNDYLKLLGYRFLERKNELILSLLDSQTRYRLRQQIEKIENNTNFITKSDIEIEYFRKIAESYSMSLDKRHDISEATDVDLSDYDSMTIDEMEYWRNSHMYNDMNTSNE